MGKITRGRDGRLYNGKGTKGGLASSSAKSALPTELPKLPSKAAAAVQSLPELIHPLSVKPKIDNVQPPEPLQELANELLDYSYEVEFANHNDDCPEDWLTLQDLLDANDYYRNNCEPLSGELCQYLYNAGFDDGTVNGFDTAQLQYSTGMHAAVSVQVDGEPWILDYTARQFDESLPVPLMLPQHQWEALIDHHIWTKYSDERRKI